MPERRTNDRHHEPLFGQAEGQHNEQRATLLNALLLIKADLHLATFCLRVFEETAARGGLAASAEQLAKLLWCSQATARRIAEKAQERGLVAKVRQYSGAGQIGSNLYRSDPSGPQRIVLGRALSAAGESGPPPPEPYAQNERGYAQNERGYAQADPAFLNTRNIPPPPPRKPDQIERTKAASAAAEEEGAGDFLDYQAACVPPAAETSARSATALSVGLAEAPAKARAAPAAWAEAERALRRTGLRATAPAAAEARDRGLSPDELASIAEFYVRHAAAWDGPGAIFHAVRQWLPGDTVSLAHFPTPTAKWLASQAAAKKQAAEAATIAEESSRDTSLAEQFAAWERQHGPTVDALTSAELFTLLQQTPLAPWAKRYARQPLGLTARETLIRHLGMQPLPALSSVPTQEPQR